MIFCAHATSVAQMAQRREVGSPGHGGGLSPGAHVLLVRARDEYGRERAARTVVEVTPAEA
jgi:hypothetical protein